MTCERKLIGRLLREESTKLSGGVRMLRHARPSASEAADAPLTVVGDRPVRPGARNAPLPIARLPTYDLDVVNLLGYFQAFFVEEGHVWFLFGFLYLFFWQLV